MDKTPGDYRIFVGAFPSGELAERIQASVDGLLGRIGLGLDHPLIQFELAATKD
jgi:hypothetical protein